MVHADSIVYGTIQERVQFTKELNAQLKFLSGLCGIGYLDVYDMYAKPDGSLRPELSDGNVHIGKEYNQGITEKLDQLFLYLHE